MNKRELLFEQYVDTVFAILMNDFAITEGMLALEESKRLKVDPNFNIPDRSHKKCLSCISGYYKKQTVKSIARYGCRFVNRIAMLVLIFILLFTTAFAALPTFRKNTADFIMKIFSNRTEIQIPSDDNTHEPGIGYILEHQWLPNEFTLVSHTESRHRAKYVYQSDKEEQFEINLIQGENTVISLDTENALVETLDIHGTSGMLCEKDDTIQILWSLDGQALFVKIKGESVLKETLIRISQNLLVTPAE